MNGMPEIMTGMPGIMTGAPRNYRGCMLDFDIQLALNTIILHDLGIVPKKPLSIWTAWHWLIKLGWCWT